MKRVYEVAPYQIRTLCPCRSKVTQSHGQRDSSVGQAATSNLPNAKWDETGFHLAAALNPIQTAARNSPWRAAGLANPDPSRRLASRAPARCTSSGILSPEGSPIPSVPPSTDPCLGIQHINRKVSPEIAQRDPPKMITKYITGITTSFSPFNPRSGKTIRNFLAQLPPNARSTMRIGVKLLGQRDAAKPAMLDLTFSMSLLLPPCLPPCLKFPQQK